MAEDGGQGVVDLVGDPRYQHAHGAHALGALQAHAGFHLGPSGVFQPGKQAELAHEEQRHQDHEGQEGQGGAPAHEVGGIAPQQDLGEVAEAHARRAEDHEEGAAPGAAPVGNELVRLCGRHPRSRPGREREPDEGERPGEIEETGPVEALPEERTREGVAHIP